MLQGLISNATSAVVLAEQRSRESKDHAGQARAQVGEAEKAFAEAQTDALSAGTTWARICETIELHNSQSKTLARAGPNTTDLTRYKEVLLRLRREGESAPGAAGY